MSVGLRVARVHLDAARPRPRSRAHVHVDFELQGCPINRHQLLEVISAFLNEPQAGDRRPQRLRRVQAAGQRLRDGRPRHALPRPGHPRRLRRALPELRPRLLRLLRADGDAERARRSSRLVEGLGVDERDVVRVYRTFNAAAEPFREESESARAMAEHGRRGRSGPTASPASRARARCTSASRDGEVEDVELQHLRAAAVLRGLAARPRVHARRRTSPRASAASARSPTR